MPISWEQFMDAQETAAIGEGLKDLESDLEWLADEFPHLKSEADSLREKIHAILRKSDEDYNEE